MKSIGFPNINKESVSSAFPVLKCTVKESGVGYDDVTKSSVCGIWDPRYFDGGYTMIADFQYGTRDIFPFYLDDITLHSTENSRSSSFLVGENDVASVGDDYLKKRESRKEATRRKSKEASRPA